MATTAEAAMADSIVSDAETTEIDDRQEEPSNVVCDAVLCFLWNKMDLIVHDTLIKLTCDYFETSAIETAKNTLFQSILEYNCIVIIIFMHHLQWDAYGRMCTDESRRTCLKTDSDG